MAEKYESIAPLLDERQRRRWLGVEARALGRGGVSAVARATGASRTTITAAVAELAGGGDDSALGRVRRAGAGRPPVSEREPGVGAALERLVDPSRLNGWLVALAGLALAGLAAFGHWWLRRASSGTRRH